jgi:XTP/dITP diphosphohydrolase
MKTVILASRNPGKVSEMRSLLEGLPVVLLSTMDYPGAPEVQEDRPTLEENARKKALALHEHTHLPAVADDTGLEVSALDGRPGVFSARYAGPEADEAANRALLLRELEGAGDRSARFRTVIAYADDGEVRLFEGECPGRIIHEERGSGGFGYDAIFVPDGDERTFAELPLAEKNAISHRGAALRKLVHFLSAEPE